MVSYLFKKFVNHLDEPFKRHAVPADPRDMWRAERSERAILSLVGAD